MSAFPRLPERFAPGALLFLFFFLFSLHASTLHLSLSGYPARLNPLLATDSTSSAIAGWIFDGLLKYDKNGNIVPAMAESFHFESDTQLVITLQKGLVWQDGAPVTAEDVVFTWQTAVSPKIFTPYSSSFRTVKNVEALDPLTVKITYTKPYFKALETWMMPLIPKHLLEKEEDLMTSPFNQQPVGTGKYTLEQLEVSKDIVLEANPTFHEGKPKIDKVAYHYVQDPSVEFLMLKSGKLDMGGLTPMQAERQLDDAFHDRYRIIETPDFSFTYLAFNLKKPPFDNPKVRKALNYALDRQEMVDILYMGHGQVCHGPFLEGTGAFNPEVKAPRRDVAKAKAMLKEAGFDEEHPLQFEIVTNANNPIRLYAAQIIQHQLKAAGVEAKVRAMEWQAFLNRVVHARKFDALVLGWALPLKPDAYSVWHSDGDKKGGFNFVGYKNEEVDRLIIEAESMVDPEAFNKAYREIFRLIVEDAPYLFLYIPNAITVINKKISPIEPTFLGIMHNQVEWIKE